MLPLNEIIIILLNKNSMWYEVIKVIHTDVIAYIIIYLIYTENIS